MVKVSVPDEITTRKLKKLSNELAPVLNFFSSIVGLRRSPSCVKDSQCSTNIQEGREKKRQKITHLFHKPLSTANL